MHFSMLPTTALRTNPTNARSHPKKQVKLLAKSIKELRYFNPIVIDEDNVILAGHGRYDAARILGLKEVPVIQLHGLPAARKRALMLADNKISDGAGWDRKRLAIEIPELSQLLIAEGLDIDITGFTAPEIDQLAIDLEDRTSDPADELDPKWCTERSISASGDHWILGDHAILCGDARNRNELARLLGDCRADVAFTDPPFNMVIRSVVGRGSIKHAEFVMASGEMSREEYRGFLHSALTAAADASRPGALHYVFQDWRHVADLIEVGRQVYSEMINLVVWEKSTAGQGSFYRSQHELIGVFRVGDEQQLNNVELGKHGRSRSNIWRYAGANTFRKGRMEDLKDHPTVKPVAMVVDALRDCTRRGDVVLDPFLGSGTTIMAAERIGRRAFALEIEPRYVDVAIRRWQTFTRRDAVHATNGVIFDEVATAREAEQRLEPSPSNAEKPQ